MAPNVSSYAPTGVLYEADEKPDVLGVATGAGDLQQQEDRPHEAQQGVDRAHRGRIVWPTVIVMGSMYAAGLQGLYQVFTSAQLATTAFALSVLLAGNLGVTAGVHRLWSHRAYKARAPLRVLLMLLHTLSLTYSVIGWARMHRTHHKYSETDADPHDSRRGFFFSHVGWTLRTKHPDVVAKGKGIDMSDLESDPILAWQKKYFPILALTLGVVLPALIPMYLWDESFLNAWCVAVALRCVCLWNTQSLINSVAHMWGNRPYERSIAARDFVASSLLTMGEGWHNYHHAFPWDYKAAELGNYRANPTTAFIDLMARVGLAYDLKTVPPAMVQARVRRAGDGTHEVWGWGDRDMADEDYGMATISHRRTRKSSHSRVQQ